MTFIIGLHLENAFCVMHPLNITTHGTTINWPLTDHYQTINSSSQYKSHQPAITDLCMGLKI